MLPSARNAREGPSANPVSVSTTRIRICNQLSLLPSPRRVATAKPFQPPNLRRCVSGAVHPASRDRRTNRMHRAGKKLDLQAPRTASSGRRLMLTNAGGSYGFRLSFSTFVVRHFAHFYVSLRLVLSATLTLPRPPSLITVNGDSGACIHSRATGSHAVERFPPPA